VLVRCAEFALWLAAAYLAWWIVFWHLWPRVLPVGRTRAIVAHPLAWALPVLLAIALGYHWSAPEFLSPLHAGIAAGAGMALLIAIAAAVRLARGWHQPITESPRDVIVALVTVVLVAFAAWLSAVVVAERMAREAGDEAPDGYVDGWDPELYELGVFWDPPEDAETDD
jgi:hypothetical protein